MSDNKKRKPQIHIALDPEIHALAKKMGDDDDRKIGNFVSKLIKDTWKKHPLNTDK